jgi:hypothetical protein
MSEEPQFKNPDDRRVDRYTFAAEVQFRSGTRRASVQVRDISALGARVSGVFLVQTGDHIFLKLPMIEAIPARVAWADSFEFGCEFDRAINDSVLTAITAPKH